PLGWIYQSATALRVARRSVRIDGLRVVCVGNLVAGGAGKTPTALAIAERLAANGGHVGFLSKGYGGRLRGPVRVDPTRHRAGDVGDEPLLLAAVHPCWIARDRVAGARAARAAGIETLILDDGFQDPALAKDVALCVVDGGFGFGNRRGVPAGPLRERIGAGLRRADAVILIGEDATGVSDIARSADAPVLAADLEVDPPGDARDRPLVAFAGVGRPEKVFESWRAAGLDLVETVAYPDHHPYDDGDWEALGAKADLRGAALATTAKDAARLPALAQPPLVIPAALRWRDAAALDRVLNRGDPA
ncbi:MAG: tetraacyldisaccharide 4'-kinase, partial [Pseudomonadota bacterium]